MTSIFWLTIFRRTKEARFRFMEKSLGGQLSALDEAGRRQVVMTLHLYSFGLHPLMAAF